MTFTKIMLLGIARILVALYVPHKAVFRIFDYEIYFFNSWSHQKG